MLDDYCQKVNVIAGRVEITSISAHIYGTDLANVKMLLECLNDKMKEIIHYDPRGNCIIAKKSPNMYLCEIRDPKENKILYTFSGSPEDIY